MTSFCSKNIFFTSIHNRPYLGYISVCWFNIWTILLKHVNFTFKTLEKMNYLIFLITKCDVRGPNGPLVKNWKFEVSYIFKTMSSVLIKFGELWTNYIFYEFFKFTKWHCFVQKITLKVLITKSLGISTFNRLKKKI